MPSPRCAVGLLTWNGERDVARCVRSVAAQSESPLEICWIDNGSSDATVARARQAALSQYKWMFSGFTANAERMREAGPVLPAPTVLPENVGFCAGHNLAFSKTSAPYYLALNQDAELAPDYIAKLCDWLDAEPELGLVSGLILEGASPHIFPPGVGRDSSPDANAVGSGEPTYSEAPTERIYSAGMAMGRGRFPFELDMGRAPADADRARRRVPAVTGCAMIVRRSAAEAIADKPGELFPPEFFAYFEEVDLALRAARAGMACGVEGSAIAWHAARGQGGAADPAIQAHYFKNHWLLSLRNDAWSDLLRESPYIVKGELFHYLRKYLASPRAAMRGLVGALRMAAWARSSRRRFESRWPNARAGRAKFYRDSIDALRR